MRFNAVPSDEERNANGPNAVSPPRVRHPLQVPSLRPISRSEAESDSSRTNPNKRARYDEHIEITKEGVKRKTSPGPWYRSIDPCTESAGWGAYYSDHLGMRQMVGQYPSSNYDPRFHMAAAPALRHPGAYGPPQVRSGRGSLRLATSNRTNSSSSPSTTPSVRSSFPVSNRGKGRKTPACRSSIPTGDAANAGELKSPVEAPVSLAEAHRVGKAVHGVAVAVSRKTKRKLPLARNAESAAIKAPQIKSEEV